MNLPFSNRAPGPGEPGVAFDARPIVAIRRNDRSAWWFAGAAVLAAVLLFSALEAQRRGASQANRQSTGATSFATPEAIPDLIVPTMPADPASALASGDGWAQPTDTQQQRATPFAAPQPQTSFGRTSPSSTHYVDGSTYPQPAQAPLLVSGEAVPGGASPAAVDGSTPNPSNAAAAKTDRVMAGRLENPATTVVQGTLINAVLETALDSSRPGQARALVTRDIYGFDGTRLLIPRGTRLYGAYEGDVAQGQKRAQIRWSRLLRPDGVSVALDSPAADPLGRAGIRGKVNNHFLERFGNALIGTAGNIGSALVTRNIASPVIVAVPGGAQSATQITTPSPNQIAPTLTVSQGTRITVFVQHDLDFSSVDEAP
jgi:type IV secretion system protein VirB10